MENMRRTEGMCKHAVDMPAPFGGQSGHRQPNGARNALRRTADPTTVGDTSAYHCKDGHAQVPWKRIQCDHGRISAPLPG